MPLLQYLLARFSEPSSYAGLGALIALIGLNFPDAAIAQLAQFLAAGCGLLALFLKERGLLGALFLMLAIGPVLSACGGPPAPSPVIATGCREYAKARKAADLLIESNAVSPAVAGKLSSIESFGAAACANPPAGDAVSTAVWLGQVAGQLAVLTADPAMGR